MTPIHITILITLGKIVFLWSVHGSQKKPIVMPVDCHTPSWHLHAWLWSSGQNKFEFIIMLSYIHWLQYHKQLNLYILYWSLNKNLKSVRMVDWFVVFNATFNNISVISWWSDLLVEETRAPGENHRPVASQWQTLSHNHVSSTPWSWAGFELTILVVIGTDCTGSCKSNYDTIMTMRAPTQKSVSY
jgi:hypothetical protein